MAIVYAAIPYGVYIQDIYGRLYQSNEWEGQQQVNGIAVITEECQFVMATVENYNAPCAWSTSLELVEDCSLDTAYPEHHFDGEGDTANIIEHFGIDHAPAAKWCSKRKFALGGYGYLGSGGEWEMVILNRTAINTCLEVLGYDKLDIQGANTINKIYWTSTQKNTDDCWGVDTSTWVHRSYGKVDSVDCYARPFCKLIL